MSKDKRKKLAKTARKTARKNIKLSLINELKAVTLKIAPLSKSIEKEIRKDAKGLAKKIAKSLVIDELAINAADQKTVADDAPKAEKKNKKAVAAES